MNLSFSQLTVYCRKFCGNISHLCPLITLSVETHKMGIILSLIPPSVSNSVALSESTLCFAKHWYSPLSLTPRLHLMIIGHNYSGCTDQHVTLTAVLTFL